MPRILRKIGIFFIFISFCAALMYHLQILPMLLPLIKAKAVSVVADRVNATMLRVLSDSRYAEKDFEQIFYDTSGSVVSVTADAAKIAAFSGDFTAAVTKDLTEVDDLEVRLPISNLLGIKAGGGRTFRVALHASNEISCEVKREFYERGINQTLHRIYADLDVEIYILLLGGTHSFHVSVPCTLTETVIVGQVPQAYTRINRFLDDVSESEIDDVYDFGAAVE